ncbi:MAG: hypothetical protein IT208_18840 [Chthonomonadales bacterium]|nr:hypothetical protein [Chthonomonadales bacterium]
MPDAPGLVPTWLGGVLLAALAALLGVAAWGWWRRALRSNWLSVAHGLEGALEAVDGRLRVRGHYRGMPAFVGEAVSYEGGVPYAHTRGALDAPNPAHLILGLRRKSVLEEMTTQRNADTAATGDADFDRAFFLVASLPDAVGVVLEPHTRRALLTQAGSEWFVRPASVEWRRPGTLRSARDIMAMLAVAADVASAVGTLPDRALRPADARAEEEILNAGL